MLRQLDDLSTCKSQLFSSLQQLIIKSSCKELQVVECRATKFQESQLPLGAELSLELKQ